jgi:hypothetical protein
LTEKLGHVHALLQSLPEIFQDVAWLYSLENSHQEEENRSEGILVRELSHKSLDAELVLIEDIVEVEGNSNFTDFDHDVWGVGAVCEEVVEEGEQMPEDVRF